MNTPVFESQWQREDWINSKTTERDVERLFSRKYQTRMLNTPQGRSLAAQLDHGIAQPVPKIFKGRRDEQEFFKAYNPQQQEAFGFAFSGAGITIPTAVIWWTSSWAIATTYPAGDGTYALYNSYIQYQGSVYAITGTVASTPGTPPPGGVWVLVAPAVGGNAWNVNPAPRLSKYASPTSFFPQPAVFTDVVDAYWYVPETQSLAAVAANFYIPAPGRGVVQTAVAQGVLQFNLAGSWTTVWTNTTTTFLWMEFDGLTARWLSTGTINAALLYYRIRQSSQG